MNLPCLGLVLPGDTSDSRNSSYNYHEGSTSCHFSEHSSQVSDPVFLFFLEETMAQSKLSNHFPLNHFRNFTKLHKNDHYVLPLQSCSKISISCSLLDLRQYCFNLSLQPFTFVNITFTFLCRCKFIETADPSKSNCCNVEVIMFPLTL